MKFEEKLINYRKKQGLSQEQLAEQLDVTRQTISKWELGQTKPDLQKLKELSKVLEIPVEELVSDEKKYQKSSNKKRKYLLYIFIILFIAAIVTLSYRVISNRRENRQNLFDSFFDIIDNSNTINDNNNINDNESANESASELFDKFSMKAFNSKFELYAGENSAFMLKSRMDTLITNNKTNSNHLIELVFDDISYGTDSEVIKDIKQSINEDKKYELSFNYNEDGYICQFVVETLK